MSHDFPTGSIDIRYNSNEYGPFGFDFTDALPSGITVSSAVVRSFSGTVKREDDLSDKTETTSSLIETASTTVSSPYVYVYFQFPTTTYTNASHTLVFELTLSNSAVHSFIFRYVKVYGDES